MKKRIHPSANVPPRKSAAPAPVAPTIRTTVPTTDILSLAENWLVDHEIDGRADTTITNRRGIIRRFHWFLTTYNLDIVDTDCLKQFFLYLQRGHNDAGGRWEVGKTGPAAVRQSVVRAPRKSTADTYYRNLHAFFEYLVVEQHIDQSPFNARIRKPGKYDRDDQITPFTDGQVEAMLNVLRLREANGPNYVRRQAKRDIAIVHLLLDTGIRAEELCGITFGDVNYKERRVNVLGKGGKRRTIRFGRETAHAVAAYMRADSQKPRPQQFTPHRGHPAAGEPFFIALRGKGSGKPLTRSGIWQIFQDLELCARITGVRCSTHTCRHTFAVNFLRAGGQPFALMEIMGHTDLTQTQKYVRFVQADIERQGALYSPMDNRPKFGYAALGGMTKPARPKREKPLGEEPAQRVLPPLPDDSPQMALLSGIAGDAELMRLAEAVRSVLGK